MLKLYGRLPWWLAVTLSVVAGVALWVIPNVTRSLRGWPLVLAYVAGGLFTAVAVGLPLLSARQAQQEARLQVGLDIDPADPVIPEYVDDEGVIDTWLRAEETRCLSSLRRKQAPARPRGSFNTATFDLDTYIAKAGTNDPLKGLTLGDLERLEDKKAAGEELTADEERALAAAREAMVSALDPVTRALEAANKFSLRMQASTTEPDNRTPEQYTEEVQQYLADCTDVLEKRTLWEYVNREVGRLGLTVVNSTDKVFEGVQIELHLPGKVNALYPDRASESPSSMPRRPHPFGQRRPRERWNGWNIPHSPVRPRPVKVPPVLGPEIGNSPESTRVTFPPLTLRPRAHVPLDDIHLVLQEPAGTVVEGTWEATATNVEGRVMGAVRLKVAATPLPVRELLAGLLGDNE